MRRYYEAQEIVPEGSEIEADFIRFDVTDILVAERNEILQLIKDHFADMEHTLVLHYCRHEENEPCNIVGVE